MPRRISIVNRIIVAVRILVQALRIRWLRNNRIRLREPPQLRIVIPRAVVVEAGGIIELLAGNFNAGMSLRSKDKGRRPYGLLLKRAGRNASLLCCVWMIAIRMSGEL